jgi:hypothetical protein
MKQNNLLTLIQGEFTPNETAEILFSLINEKIRFHDLQILGLKERNIDNALLHTKRLEELIATKKIIQDIVTEARNNQDLIVVNSTIELQLKKNILNGCLVK